MVLVYLLLFVLTLAVILSVVVFVKYFCDSETVMCKSTEKMHGKTVVITGASSGIGKEAARELAKRGAKVIMACRNMEKAEAVKNEIVECSGNENVHVSKLDLSSFKSIREFADNLIETEDKIDVLIHNAGTAEMRYHLTEDGLERTMATNHFGPFNLTLRLIKLMKASAPSRIVIVASDLYRLASLDTDDLSVDRIRIPAYIYYVSKYCNMIYTMELARRLKGTGVTANCLHPGMIDSGIWRNVPAPLSWPLKLICKVFFKTPVQGAQTIIYLATSEDVKDVSGQYFIDCKEQPVDPVLRDTLRGRQLWQNSLLSVDLRLRDIRI